jgi:UDP-N-acetylglucosamine acyltransferase
MVHGLNVVGLRRRGFTAEQRNRMKEAYRIIYSGKPRKEIIAEMEEKFRGQDYLLRLAEFLKTSKRGIVGQHGETE